MKSAGHHAYDKWLGEEPGGIPWEDLPEETRQHWEAAAAGALEAHYQRSLKQG